jgi:nucleotide-binding universal stress UspA family protein
MKILLAVDASKFSRAAIQAVIRGFRAGTEVRVLHVLEPIAAYFSADLFPHFVPHIAKLEEDRRKQAQELIKRIAAKLRKAGFRATELVDWGDPKSTIIARAAEWKADLIVLGSHGLKGLNRLLMGSVSEAVIRHAPCSVQVVRIRGSLTRTRRSSPRRIRHSRNRG